MRSWRRVALAARARSPTKLWLGATGACRRPMDRVGTGRLSGIGRTSPGCIRYLHLRAQTTWTRRSPRLSPPQIRSCGTSASASSLFEPSATRLSSGSALCSVVLSGPRARTASRAGGASFSVPGEVQDRTPATETQARLRLRSATSRWGSPSAASSSEHRKFKLPSARCSVATQLRNAEMPSPKGLESRIPPHLESEALGLARRLRVGSPGQEQGPQEPGARICWVPTASAWR